MTWSFYWYQDENGVENLDELSTMSGVKTWELLIHPSSQPVSLFTGCELGWINNSHVFTPDIVDNSSRFSTPFSLHRAETQSNFTAEANHEKAKKETSDTRIANAGPELGWINNSHVFTPDIVDNSSRFSTPFSS
jgi:hypothetical protein